MKKILFITLAFFVTINSFCQLRPDINENANDITSIETRNTNQSDSIIDVYALITAMQAEIDILTGSDTTSPVLNHGDVFESNPQKWVLSFSETLSITSSDSISDNLSLTENGVSVSIDSIQFDESVLNVYTRSILGGATLRVSWEEPVSDGIEDESGNTLNTFVDSTVKVFNNAVTVIDYLAWYKFDEDFTDESGNYPGTKNGTITFEDSIAVWSGSSGSDYLDIRVKEFKTAKYRLYKDDDTDDHYYIWSNGNSGGSELGISTKTVFSGGSGYIFCRAGNGSITGYAQTGAILSGDTWYDIMEVFDPIGNGTDAYWWCYVDGVQSATDIVLQNMSGELNYDGVMKIGVTGIESSGLMNNDKLDELAFLYDAGTAALADSFDTNPFRMPFRDVSPEPDPPVDSAFIIKFAEDWSTQTSLGDYTNTELRNDFNTFDYTGGITLPEYSTTLKVDNDTTLRLFTDEATQTRSDFNIQLDSVYEELYLTFSMRPRDGMIITPDPALLPIPSYDGYYADNINDYGGKLPGFQSNWGYGDGHIHPKYCEAGETCTNPVDGGFRSRLRWSYLGEAGTYGYDHTAYFNTGSTSFSSYVNNLGHNWWTPTDSSNYLIYDNVDWVKVTFRIGMNTVGSANGTLNVYEGDSCIYGRNNVVWRSNADVGIHHVMMTYLFGGHGYAIVDEYLNIDGLVVWRYADDIPGSTDYPTVKTQNQMNITGDKIPLPEETNVR